VVCCVVRLGLSACMHRVCVWHWYIVFCLVRTILEERDCGILCTKIEKIGYICNNDAFVLGIPFGWMEGKEKCKYKALLESRR